MCKYTTQVTYQIFKHKDIKYKYFNNLIEKTWQHDNCNLLIKGNCLISYVKTFAGIICDSGAASIKDCHVFVELGITKPNSKNHSERTKVHV